MCRLLALLALGLGLIVVPELIPSSIFVAVSEAAADGGDGGDGGGGDGGGGDGGGGDGGDGGGDGGDGGGDGGDGGGDGGDGGGDGGDGGGDGGDGGGDGGDGSGDGGDGGGDGDGDGGGDDGAGGDDGDGGDDGGDDGDSDDGGDDGNEDGDDAGDDDDDANEGDDDGDLSSAVEGALEGLFDLFGDQSGGNRDFLQREIFVFGPQALLPQERAALNDAGFRILSEDSLVALGTTVTRLAQPVGLSGEDALEIARPLAPGLTFELNHLYRPGSAPCEAAICWDRRQIGMDQLAANACVRGAPIAIIDTAVALDHEALRGASIRSRSFLPEDAVPAISDHGTAIAALLVGETAPWAPPLAPGARLLAAQAFRDIEGEPQADAVAILRALDWAVAQRARVIAMSIEGPPNAALAFGVRAASHRANLVAAAGNGGAGAAPAYPAAYPEVMAVAAVDRRRRSYRNGTRGAYVEIAAPGVGILSVGSKGDSKTWTGSSFAVPFVVAALLRARAETRGDPDKARALLAGTAMDLGEVGRDDVYGHGLLRTPRAGCY
ncbi:MAG: S8 family serine peptidase [Pseudomonadota bacterium]